MRLPDLPNHRKPHCWYCGHVCAHTGYCINRGCPIYKGAKGGVLLQSYLTVHPYRKEEFNEIVLPDYLRVEPCWEWYEIWHGNNFVGHYFPDRKEIVPAPSCKFREGEIHE